MAGRATQAAGLHTTAPASMAISPKNTARKTKAAGQGIGPPDWGYKKNPGPKAPPLKKVLRQFTAKVHPDLFGAYPDLRETNDSSLQVLQGILAGAKSGEKDDYLAVQRHEVEFFLRTGENGNFLRVPLILEVKGAHSKHVLGRQLAKLFHFAGLPTNFAWGSEYWDQRIKASKPPPEEEDDEHYA